MSHSSSKIAPTAWLLLATRFLRSIWQGALVVDFALYLDALGWSAVPISAVLAAALIFGAILTMLLGPLSDRFGRRRFLLVYEALQGAAAAVAFFTSATIPLTIAAIIGGFGRGGNGAAGPFSPVEQAWLAQCVPASERGPLYSLNASLGFMGMALGAVVAGLPGWLEGSPHPAAHAYQWLFALTALLSVVSFVLIFKGRDTESAPTIATPTPTATDDRVERQRENKLLRRLVLANILNGTGAGLTGPLLTYWFAIKFHHEPGTIGPIFALSFLLAALSSLVARRLTRRLGVVRTVVVMRIVGVLLLLALPFAGTFVWASVIYVGRSMFNRGTMGSRSALNVGLVRPSRRGFSAASANVALQIPRSIGPLIAGLFFEAGELSAPFLIAVVFQGAYIWLYDRSFRNVTLQ